MAELTYLSRGDRDMMSAWMTTDVRTSWVSPGPPAPSVCSLAGLRPQCLYTSEETQTHTHSHWVWFGYGFSCIYQLLTSSLFISISWLLKLDRSSSTYNKKNVQFVAQSILCHLCPGGPEGQHWERVRPVPPACLKPTPEPDSVFTISHWT